MADSDMLDFQIYLQNSHMVLPITVEPIEMRPLGRRICYRETVGVDEVSRTALS